MLISSRSMSYSIGSAMVYFMVEGEDEGEDEDRDEDEEDGDEESPPMPCDSPLSGMSSCTSAINDFSGGIGTWYPSSG